MRATEYPNTFRYSSKHIFLYRPSNLNAINNFKEDKLDIWRENAIDFILVMPPRYD